VCKRRDSAPLDKSSKLSQAPSYRFNRHRKDPFLYPKPLTSLVEIDLTPLIWCYMHALSLGVVQVTGIIIVQMPDADTLWIEALRGASVNPTSWAFTDDKTSFER
jgi:hypothetical protein